MLHAEQIAEKNRVIEEKDADAVKEKEKMENSFKHFSNLLVDARLKICHHTKGGGAHNF